VQGVERRFGFLLDALDTLHWTLPKTSDADYVVAGLRRSVTESEPVFRDANGYLAIVGAPEGLVRENAEATDLSGAPAVWVARDPAGAESARIALSRRDRREPEDATPGGKRKLRSPGSFSSEYAKALVENGVSTDKPVRSNRREAGDLEVSWVRWRERTAENDVERAHGFAAVEDVLYEIDVRFEPSFGTGDERDAALKRFLAELRVEKKSAVNLPPEAWYARTFGWTAPWRYNAFVSIGTSLLFALVLLLVARWRLARMDF